MDFSAQKYNYSVLKETDIRALMEDEIKRLSGMLSISKAAATILLVHHEWSLNRIFDSWVVDQEKVFEKVGLSVKNLVSDSSCTKLDYDFICGICFESYPFVENSELIFMAACGRHPFCKSCWGDYISASIKNGGPECLKMRCPDPDCVATVDQDLIESLASNDDDKRKYNWYLVRSYMEYNTEVIKWCPSPAGCEYAVGFLGDTDTGCYDVICRCSHTFCWNCLEESHRPVTCNNATTWILKSNDESENLNWIGAYTKPCPNCKRRIEKDEQGCAHMTCAAPCGFEFCWTCLGEWSEHGDSCDPCKLFTQGNTEIEGKSAAAKKSIERYSRYYELWATNYLSMEKALADLNRVENEHVKKIGEIYALNKPTLNFITEAWLLIAQCRRVLKWTSAYGYFLSEHEIAKEQYLVFLQENAESTLGRHCEYVEKELQQFLEATTSKSDHALGDFNRKITRMTCITGNYFQDFVKTVENGLSEVRAFSYGHDTGGNHWFCDRCTYANYWSAMECEMCCDSLSVEVLSYLLDS